MAVSIKDLGIDRLPPEDRLQLMQEIWDSLATETGQAPLSEAQRKDLERRLAAYETNPKAGPSWEEVKARLLERP